MDFRYMRIQGSVLILFFCGVSYISRADTDIHFSGILVAEPCQLATDSEEQTVDFGSIVAKQFINNPLAPPKGFSLRLTDCDLSLGQSVTFTFTGDESTEQPGLFAVVGEAKGIAVLLMDEDEQTIRPGHAVSSLSLTGSENAFTFQAVVSGPEFSAISAGEFTSTVIFSLEYN